MTGKLVIALAQLNPTVGAIQANLAKTKLDAYGIPCFLTEENFTSLNPFRNDIFPGVRLHIFEKDKPRVVEILTEEAD